MPTTATGSRALCDTELAVLHFLQLRTLRRLSPDAGGGLWAASAALLFAPATSGKDEAARSKRRHHRFVTAAVTLLSPGLPARNPSR
jgi:hypothetical protein